MKSTRKSRGMDLLLTCLTFQYVSGPMIGPAILAVCAVPGRQISNGVDVVEVTGPRVEKSNSIWPCRERCQMTVPLFVISLRIAALVARKVTRENIAEMSSHSRMKLSLRDGRDNFMAHASPRRSMRHEATQRDRHKGKRIQPTPDHVLAERQGNGSEQLVALVCRGMIVVRRAPPPSTPKHCILHQNRVSKFSEFASLINIYEF